MGQGRRLLDREGLVVRSYEFQIQCFDDYPVVCAEITENLDLVFDDERVNEEIDNVLAAIELGFKAYDIKMSPCVEAYINWDQRGASMFVAKQPLIPLLDICYVGCAWADVIIDSLDHSDIDQVLEAEKAISLIRRFILGAGVRTKTIRDLRSLHLRRVRTPIGVGGEAINSLFLAALSANKVGAEQITRNAISAIGTLFWIALSHQESHNKIKDIMTRTTVESLIELQEIKDEASQ